MSYDSSLDPKKLFTYIKAIAEQRRSSEFSLGASGFSPGAPRELVGVPCELPGKTHSTFRKQNLSFYLMHQARLELIMDERPISKSQSPYPLRSQNPVCKNIKRS